MPNVPRAALTTVGAALLAAGVALGTTTVVAPEVVERAYGVVQITAAKVVNSVVRPEVRLGATGGQRELDRFDGTFTEMTAYEREGVPPVWAAHNNAGGDAVLPLEIGDEITVVDAAGAASIHRVVDVRITAKYGVTADELVGLGGELALQSCFFGEPRMRFVGLERVSA